MGIAQSWSLLVGVYLQPNAQKPASVMLFGGEKKSVEIEWKASQPMHNSWISLSSACRRNAHIKSTSEHVLRESKQPKNVHAQVIMSAYCKAPFSVIYPCAELGPIFPAWVLFRHNNATTTTQRELLQPRSLCRKQRRTISVNIWQIKTSISGTNCLSFPQRCI